MRTHGVDEILARRMLIALAIGRTAHRMLIVAIGRTGYPAAAQNAS
jgi:hypothetical protein